MSHKENAERSSDHLYLEKLRFNPELRKSWLNFFIVNFRVVILLIIVLTGWGLYSFFTLPRESNPEVKIPIAVVVTAYPGAAPGDVEELVTKKIETGISGLKDLKKISSDSSNSLSAITVEFDAKANLDDSLRRLRDEVNSLKKNLPEEANEPSVNEVSFDDTPIWTISLTGPYDGRRLRDYADNIKDELEKVSGIREVRVSGGDQTEFEVAYDPQKLALYGLSADQANQAIKGVNLTVPAGSFEGRQYDYSVRSDARFFQAERLAELPIIHTDDGAVVMLKDIAAVSEKNIKKTVYSRLSIKGAQPENDVTIQVIKKTGSSIIEAIDAAKAKVDTLVKAMPAGTKYDVTLDSAQEIRDNFDQLTHDFILTIILVFIVLFLIVGLKEALVAGLAVPLVFFATFGVMQLTGTTLNFLSIFSLILALGLLVDDAIVVVSATKQYMKTGKFTPEEAILLVLNDFKTVLTTTTLATVWAFLPLLMSTGIMGEFIKSIPITVSVTLVASLIIALIVNHPLAAILERIRLTRRLFFVCLGSLALLILAFLNIGNLWLRFGLIWLDLIALSRLAYWYALKGRRQLRHNEALVRQEWRDDEAIKKKLREQGRHDKENLVSRLIHGIIRFDVALPVYEKYLRRLLANRRSRWLTLAVTGAIFMIAVSLPLTGIVKSEFFPKSDFTTIYINLKAANGLKLDETDKIVREVESRLLKYPEIINFSTLVGVSSSAHISSVGGSSSHIASITLKLSDKKERNIKSYILAEKIRSDLSDIKQAEITVESPESGPPAGAAFEARISGDDLQVLDKIAKDLKPRLAGIEGVIDADTSLKAAPAEYSFRLDPVRLELYNLNAAYVGSSLRLAIAGTEVTKVIRDGDEIKVIARFAEDKLPDLEAIQNLQILNLRKQPVFLKDVAKIELQPGVDKIERIDQKRVVLLSAGTDSRTNSNLVLAEFQKLIKDYQFPAGYEISYGGENEQNTESVLSIIRAMILAGILIVSTMVIQFNSFRQSLIVLVTIPLALIGVFFGMAIVGINLSFPGLIGILALFGIVVKNAIILIDKMNLNLKSGIAFKDAVVDAGKSRLEAIFITSICTILGIIPITLSDETWRALGGAIIFGLLLSSFLTLFIVPTLFMTLVKDPERE